jgi:hypothetical protein
MGARYMKHLHPARHKWTPPASNNDNGGSNHGADSDHSTWTPKGSQGHCK